MMRITVDVPNHIEAKLRSSVAQGDIEATRLLLADALTPTVEAMILNSASALTDVEFESLADQLAEEFAANVGPAVPVLSDEAVSRTGIYQDHP